MRFLRTWFAAPLSRIPDWIVLALALEALAVFMFLRAWVAEDAYITFRVIENFFAGYGLRWNTHERVQVYTHPLWLLIHIPVYAVWKNLFHATIAVSIACVTGALALVFSSTKRPRLIALGLFLLPLALSKSFMDYTTSGLETPLCYLLFAFFGYVIIRLRAHPQFWFYLSLSVGLAVLNRFDNAIIYTPTLVYLVVTQWKDVNWRQIRWGAAPLIAWLIFALIYYGFIFPNTKYAKLDTGLPLTLYLQQSVNYVKYLLIFDSPGFIVLCSSLLFIFRKDAIPACIALGVYFYFLYVLFIGGDYMAGRFWAFPIFISAWLWYAFPPTHFRTDTMFACICLLLVAFVATPLIRDINKNCSNCMELKGRILDATRTFQLNRLVEKTDPLTLRKKGRYPFCRDGKKLSETPVKVMFYVGMHAYCAGPELKAIDMLGLGDPLMARLPANQAQGFYIGHFRRKIPDGYIYAIDTGDTSRMQPDLEIYYQRLRLITSGDIWDFQRLLTIVFFNFGYYDKYKEDYVHSLQ